MERRRETETEADPGEPMYRFGSEGGEDCCSLSRPPSRAGAPSSMDSSIVHGRLSLPWTDPWSLGSSIVHREFHHPRAAPSSTGNSIVHGQIPDPWHLCCPWAAPPSTGSSNVHGQLHHPWAAPSSTGSSTVGERLHHQSTTPLSVATPPSGRLNPSSSLGKKPVIHDSLFCLIFHIPSVRMCSWLCP